VGTDLVEERVGPAHEGDAGLGVVVDLVEFVDLTRHHRASTGVVQRRTGPLHGVSLCSPHASVVYAAANSSCDVSSSGRVTGSVYQKGGAVHPIQAALPVTESSARAAPDGVSATAIEAATPTNRVERDQAVLMTTSRATC
jgi:hypothetical protein